jgi:hypothetical protein
MMAKAAQMAQGDQTILVIAFSIFLAFIIISIVIDISQNIRAAKRRGKLNDR